MAVAYDASSFQGTGTSTFTTSTSWTHTPTGTPKGVIVWVAHYGTTSTDDVTSVTYGGIPMDYIGTRAGDANLVGFIDLYFLGADVPTGAQTIAISAGSAAKRAWARTVTAATASTKIQNTVTQAPTSYTRASTVSGPSLALSGVSSWVDECLTNSNTAVGRSAPRTGWTSVSNSYEHDWTSNVSAAYYYNTVGTSDVTTGFVGSTDSSSGYYALYAVAVAEDANPGKRASDTALASDAFAAIRPGAITRDTGGTSFPASTSSGTNAAVSLTISTGEADALLIISIGIGNSGGTTVGPPTVAWTGGDPGTTALAVSQENDANGTPNTYATHNVYIYTCPLSGTISNKQLTVTPAGAGSGAQLTALVIDALHNAEVSSNVKTKEIQSSSALSVTSFPEAFQFGSRIYAACVSEDSSGALSLVSGTLNEIAVLNDNSSGTYITEGFGIADGSSTTVGWSTTSTFGAVCAVEIREKPQPTGQVFFSDTARASDDAQAQMRASQTASDTAAASDDFLSEKSSGTYERIYSDTARASDDAQAQMPAAQIYSDTARASDDAQAQMRAAQTASDTARASDDAQASYKISHTASDTAKASDDAQASYKISQTAQDTARASDDAQAQMRAAQSASDTAAASDGFEWIAVSVEDKLGYASATALASDAAQAQMRAAQTATDSAAASDQFQAAVSVACDFLDQAAASDSWVCALRATARASDSAVALDGFDFAVLSTSVGADASDAAAASDRFSAKRSEPDFPMNLYLWDGANWVYFDGGMWRP